MSRRVLVVVLVVVVVVLVCAGGDPKVEQRVTPVTAAPAIPRVLP